MTLFECDIDLKGSWITVQVTAETDRQAYQLLCAQYGQDVVKGYPHPVIKTGWLG